MARGFSFKPVGLSDFAQLTANRQAFEKDRNQSIKNAISGIGRGIIENNINKKYADNPMGIAAMKERAVRYAPIDPAEAKIYADLVNKAEKFAADKAAREQKAFDDANELGPSVNVEFPDGSSRLVKISKDGKRTFDVVTKQYIELEEGATLAGKAVTQAVAPERVAAEEILNFKKILKADPLFKPSMVKSGVPDGDQVTRITTTLLNYAKARQAEDQSSRRKVEPLNKYFLEGKDLLKDPSGALLPGLISEDYDAKVDFDKIMSILGLDNPNKDTQTSDQNNSLDVTLEQLRQEIQVTPPKENSTVVK